MPSLNYLNTYFPFTRFNHLFYQNLNPAHSFPNQTKSLKEKEKEKLPAGNLNEYFLTHQISEVTKVALKMWTSQLCFLLMSL